MNKFSALFLRLMVLGLGIAHAQTVAPLVKFPVGDAAWSVELINKPAPPADGAAQKDRRLQGVRIDRFGGLRRDQTVWTDGSKMETWSTVSPRLMLYLDERINEIVTATPGEELDFFRLDESAFDWIQRRNRMGEEQVGGVECAIYEGLAYAGEGGKGLPLRVWIDESTLLPRQLESGGAKYGFTFHEKVDVPLIMTEAFQSRLNRYRNALASPTRVGKRDRSAGK